MSITLIENEVLIALVTIKTKRPRKCELPPWVWRVIELSFDPPCFYLLSFFRLSKNSFDYFEKIHQSTLFSNPNVPK